MVRQALSNNKTGWLFPNKYGKRMSKNTLNRHLKEWSKKATGVKFTTHHFRRRFLTKAVGTGKLADIKRISGIRSEKVLMKHYARHTKEGQKKVFDAVK